MNYLKPLIFSLALGWILQGNTPYVIMVSFDGLRYDYPDRTETPYFDYLRDNGVKAESLQPVFPSKTFPNHYSLATGAYTQTHMLTGNSFYDKKFKERYSISDRETVQDPKWYKAEPIWTTAERQGVKSASYFWVGSEAPIKNFPPSIFKYYDGDVPYEARVDSVIAWLQLPETNRPHLIMLYFDEPDNSGHVVGPESPLINEKMKYLDGILGRLIVGLESLSITDELNLFVVSDHGMTTISIDKVIVLDQYVDTDNFIIQNDGPFAQIDVKFFWQRIPLIRNLKTIPGISAYPRKSIPDRFHFVNRNTMDYLLVANDGWTILTNETIDGNYRLSAGNHGFDPQVKNMHGIFYAKGAAIRSGITIETFENIHVYPLVCEILGLQPYESSDDAPEGDLKILSPILKHSSID